MKRLYPLLRCVSAVPDRPDFEKSATLGTWDRACEDVASTKINMGGANLLSLLPFNPETGNNNKLIFSERFFSGHRGYNRIRLNRQPETDFRSGGYRSSIAIPD
ncbi:MAG: hypothetical protein D6728_01090 [Cyanobacteria bacterium J055]|nr:MAG: hypothetical protein D6728_01090 [Cyanobacteria bacterium J055]